MNIYTIYKATNKINGKSYIGFDSKWPNRKQEHKKYYNKQNRKSRSSFYDAISKYGWESFEWNVVYQSKDKNHTKNIMENHFIIEFRTYCGFDDCNGYNLTLGGEGILGLKLTEKTKQILRESAIDRFKDEEIRKRHSETMKKWNNNLSEEQKNSISKKVSKSLKGNKRALGMTYTHTIEAKEKISCSKKGKKMSEESVNKLKLSRTGKGLGERNAMAKEENRTKVAESKIGRKKYINPNTKQGKYCFPGTEPFGFVLATQYKNIQNFL